MTQVRTDYQVAEISPRYLPDGYGLDAKNKKKTDFGYLNFTSDHTLCAAGRDIIVVIDGVLYGRYYFILLLYFPRKKTSSLSSFFS